MLAIAKQFLGEKLGLVQTARELLQFRDGEPDAVRGAGVEAAV